MANNCSRDFFAEMKKLNPKPSASSSVNALDSEEEIAKFFSEKYSALYNSVESDSECMASILNQICTGAGKCPLDDHCISFTVVQEAVRKLKQGKRDRDKGLVSNHLPSPARCTSDSRFQTWTPTKNSMHLRTSDLQFAFKKAFSTSMCTLALNRLREADDKCWMGQTYFGVLVYADNITLLTPSASGLKRMINICNDFCSSRGVRFNTTKLVCIRFSQARGRPKPDVKLGGSGLEWSRSVKHLGNTLTENLNEEDEVTSKRGNLCSSATL
ncbi:hypothetical protein CAPTEDRAFT_195397 [Capitella teleta]|uniref:Reverse transcriptase domain-containing protein n=1 Tax=Capitella teleta TaxID=283909 RepID=R7VKB0_CAPTE|nr:hypothetical protein CAPTEDRAFT_195397 [Capitella teleta]|eukprot:ELU16640.1 hypothetical protein CAPTEDRAFT_195397 [Capitella teleta]